jgi:hypothetical protein
MKHPTTTSDPATVPCVYCERPDCTTRFEHRRLHGQSEISAWRLAMAGESDAFGRAKAACRAVSS